MAHTQLKAQIRRARPEEAEALTALIMRAKAHWGYDQPFLDACYPLLRLDPEVIAHDPVYCAEIAGKLAGVSHLIVLDNGEIELDHLFVEPAFIGHGIGGLLWQHAVEQARTLGARAIVLGADPNARPFYEHMGAIVVGEIASPIVEGRTNPKMRYELSEH